LKLRKRVFSRIGGKRGFTLIELLIVLTILAVLAAVVVLALTGFIGRGKSQACEAEQQSLQTSVYTYYYENDGDWPTADGNPGAISYTLLIGGYIDATPQYDDGGADDCDWVVDEDVEGQVCVPPAAVGTCPCAADVPNCAD
jgi:prepilin-type N-terminal cleavage/methylation domain-containing protein